MQGTKYKDPLHHCNVARISETDFAMGHHFHLQAMAVDGSLLELEFLGFNSAQIQNNCLTYYHHLYFLHHELHRELEDPGSEGARLVRISFHEFRFELVLEMGQWLNSRSKDVSNSQGSFTSDLGSDELGREIHRGHWPRHLTAT
ncbi:hypothetical protein BT96DRAFT_944222 [Gymnopus androsaceus JB14]|uniref:Uncharacterized protein n=1 Tax=Gymnopus androsaceus JB14 TaxID=1447944 RepID=A0A6A4H4D9_9AGAR|nr:hypothetical protein BT96DRAFT_944222 [Gymnopus androsaceus JB14]